jgi:hypothetical protein
VLAAPRQERPGNAIDSGKKDGILTMPMLARVAFVTALIAMLDFCIATDSRAAGRS